MNTRGAGHHKRDEHRGAGHHKRDEHRGAGHQEGCILPRLMPCLSL